jgi:hypothetical protein
VIIFGEGGGLVAIREMASAARGAGCTVSA